MVALRFRQSPSLLSFFANVLLAQPSSWMRHREAMPMDPPPVNCASAEYREMAGELRTLARLARFPGSRRDLLDLAARLDRKADHFENHEIRERDRSPDRI
jgi:hypothetical protein